MHNYQMNSIWVIVSIEDNTKMSSVHTTMKLNSLALNISVYYVFSKNILLFLEPFCFVLFCFAFYLGCIQK